MKAEHAISTQAKTKAPFWVDASASLASVAMLAAISSYNVAPTLSRAIKGDPAAIGLAFVQVAFTIFLAIIPFVPGWDAKARKRLTIIFMLGNGYFAFEIAGHRHDSERTAINQHDAIVTEQNAKKVELAKLGAFTHTDDYQVVYAQDAAKTADAAKLTARAAANGAGTNYAACKKGCDKLKSEVTRLEADAGRQDEETRKAHAEVDKLSAWATLTKQAAPIQARIDELQKKLNEEKFVADTGTKSENGRTIEALLIALLIELGNRFGPEAIYKFFRQLGRREEDEERPEARAVVERQATPAPVPAPAQAAHVIEADDPIEPAPLPPPPSPRRRTAKTRKPRPKPAVISGPGAVVLAFKKRPTQAEVLALVASGKTQKQIAGIFDCTDRTIRNILSGKRAEENAISFPA